MFVILWLFYCLEEELSFLLYYAHLTNTSRLLNFHNQAHKNDSIQLCDMVMFILLIILCFHSTSFPSYKKSYIITYKCAFCSLFTMKRLWTAGERPKHEVSVNLNWHNSERYGAFLGLAWLVERCGGLVQVPNTVTPKVQHHKFYCPSSYLQSNNLLLETIIPIKH